MCYGDPGHGKDGYYQAEMNEQPKIEDAVSPSLSTAGLDALKQALKPLADCHLPPDGCEHLGVIAHFTTEQIIAAKTAMSNVK